MLNPNDRTLLLEAIRPDPGYRLDHALITTYSLDLRALLAVPLALTFHDWEETDAGEPRVDPVALLEALRANAERLTVLCQAGEIGVPAPQRNLFAFLESAVIPVSAPLGGVFHPKVWILRYVAEGDAAQPRYRLLCASRNLTYDRSWDVLLALDGLVRSGERAVRRTRPVSAFVRGLRELAATATAELTKDREAALAEIVREIGRVEFDPPEGVSELRFHPLGLEKSSRDPFDGRRDRMLVISPFLGASRVTRLGAGPRSVLVSLQQSLDELPLEAVEGFGDVRVLSDLADPEPLDLDDDSAVSEASQSTAETANRASESPEAVLRGLHAKVYVADAGWDAKLWIGSANATSAAFSRNVEFLVELAGRKRQCGIDAVLGSDEGGLRSLLERYRRGDVAPERKDERKAERLADDAAHALGACQLELHVVEDGDPAESRRYSIEFRAPEGLPDEIAGVEVSVWPITISSDRGVGLEAAAATPWRGLETEQLTAFLAASITASVGAASVERRITLRTSLRGVPADRDGAIVRSILSSPERLLRYLAFLLADLDGDPSSAVYMVEALTHEPGSTASPGYRAPALELPLLEGLVKALARDPTRIDRIERLVREVSSTPQGRELLPRDFELIFAPVREARERLRRQP